MTEDQWNSCTDPQLMLNSLRSTSNRKLRLFGCACGRRAWSGLTDPADRTAVEIAERYADGQAREAELDTAWRVAGASSFLVQRRSDKSVINDAAWAMVRSKGMTATTASAGVRLMEEERIAQAGLVRHLFGNPFRPLNKPRQLPSIVIQLAHALYEGEDSVFALHDALLEAGHGSLADHFRKEDWHPKGCWAVDVVLDKT